MSLAKIQIFISFAIIAILGLLAEYASCAQPTPTSYHIVAAFRFDQGLGPIGPPLVYANGVIYGATSNFGQIPPTIPSGAGTLFSCNLTKGTLAMLHTFRDPNFPPVIPNGQAGGYYPSGPLISARDGLLYGTTNVGGDSSPTLISDHGHGIIFSYNPATSEFKIVHVFQDESVQNDGAFPEGTLVEGQDDLIYGTTDHGGTKKSGTIYSFDPMKSTITILHNFGDGSVGLDGENPKDGLVKASNSMFYGTTSYGGQYNQGTLYSFNKSDNQVTILHSFSDDSKAHGGCYPDSNPCISSSGILYGVAGGGTTEDGTIYSFNPADSSFKILHSFDGCSSTSDGSGPEGLIQASDGNLYGCTNSGGASCYGTVFEYDLTASDLRTLHVFADPTMKEDGGGPNGPLVQLPDGSLIGCVSAGNNDNVDSNGQPACQYGAIFELNIGLPTPLTN